MTSRLERTSEFQGRAGDAHRSKLPPGVFQEDVNGDRFSQGSWKRRRGMIHADIPVLTTVSETIFGFEIPGGEYGLVFGGTTVVQGAVGVGEQTFPPPPPDEGDEMGGFGEDYGEGGDGEGEGYGE